MIRRPLLLLVSLVAASCGDNQTPPPEKGPYVGTSPAALECVPNLDGKIDARELAPRIGADAHYLVSPAGKERPVDLVGAEVDGRRVWSFGNDFADDQVARFSAQKIDGKWYASSFASVPGAFVVPLDPAAQTDGVYTHTERGFFLHGVASKEPEPLEQKTLLVYDPPATLYQFPLTPGLSYRTTARVRNGTFRGLPFASEDTYDVIVDGAGQLSLPDFILTQALRVRTTVTVVPTAGQTTTQRQTSFLFECIGEAARATSRLGEPDPNFTTAAELRRLGLGNQGDAR
jgi:hypothetical protein